MRQRSALYCIHYYLSPPCTLYRFLSVSIQGDVLLFLDMDTSLFWVLLFFPLLLFTGYFCTDMVLTQISSIFTVFSSLSTDVNTLVYFIWVLLLPISLLPLKPFGGNLNVYSFSQLPVVYITAAFWRAFPRGFGLTILNVYYGF